MPKQIQYEPVFSTVGKKIPVCALTHREKEQHIYYLQASNVGISNYLNSNKRKLTRRQAQHLTDMIISQQRVIRECQEQLRQLQPATVGGKAVNVT